MLSYLIVMLDQEAVPFCYYEAGPAGEEPRRMSAETLESALAFARREKLAVNFLYGSPPPAAQARLIEAFSPHVKIVPLSLAGDHRDGVIVVNAADDRAAIASLSASAERNVILRAARADLPALPELFLSLLGKFRRLNLILTGIPEYGESDLEEYRKALKAMAPHLVAELKAGRPAEVSALTDRILLPAMSNCRAGIIHLTVSPGGGLFVCPGFYHRREPDGRAGNVREPAAIANAHLLELASAPICSACDAFQCKRCLYLNKAVTREMNTPSHEQCVLSHFERAASSLILEELRALPAFAGLAPIPRLDYDDPLEKIMARQRGKLVNRPPTDAAAPPGREPAPGRRPEDMTDRELLQQILKNQIELSNKIEHLGRQMNHARK